jgi:hypothetical protein
MSFSEYPGTVADRFIARPLTYIKRLLIMSLLIGMVGCSDEKVGISEQSDHADGTMDIGKGDPGDSSDMSDNRGHGDSTSDTHKDIKPERDTIGGTENECTPVNWSQVEAGIDCEFYGWCGTHDPLVVPTRREVAELLVAPFVDDPKGWGLTPDRGRFICADVAPIATGYREIVMGLQYELLWCEDNQFGLELGIDSCWLAKLLSRLPPTHP